MKKWVDAWKKAGTPPLVPPQKEPLSVGEQATADLNKSKRQKQTERMYPKK